MSTVVRNSPGSGYTVYTKGASEMILNKCTEVLDREGNSMPFGPQDRSNMMSKVIQPFAQEKIWPRITDSAIIDVLSPDRMLSEQ